MPSQVRWARNLKLKDVEVIWDKPASAKWQSALRVDDAQDVELDGFSGTAGGGRRAGRGFRKCGWRGGAEFERRARHGSVSGHCGRKEPRNSPDSATI